MAQFHVSRHYTESLAPHTSSVGVSNTAAGRRAWLARPYWKAIQYGSLSLRRQVDRGSRDCRGTQVRLCPFLPSSGSPRQLSGAELPITAIHSAALHRVACGPLFASDNIPSPIRLPLPGALQRCRQPKRKSALELHPSPLGPAFVVAAPAHRFRHSWPRLSGSAS
jgi:hypothetical protein